MIIENLPSLQIHRLTQAQYQKLVDAGKADDKALYLVPDDDSGDININVSTSIDDGSTHDEIPSAKATVDYVKSQAPIIADDLSAGGLDGKIPSAKATYDYVNAEISALIEGEKYGGALDTIKEIQEALKENPDVITDLEQAIEDRVSKSVYNTDLTLIRTGLETVSTTLNEKVNVSELEDYTEELNATIETLATKAEVDTRVSKNTYTTDLSLIREALETASELINTKADQGDLEALTEDVGLALETKANKDETSAAITALDNEIEATNEALKTKVNNSDIVNDAILAGSTKIPTAGLVHSFVKGEIAIPEAIQLQIWSQEDGWYHVTSTLQVSNDKFIELNDESILLKQGQHFICWQPNGDTITGWSDASMCEYTIRSTTEEIVDGSAALPTAQAVINYINSVLVDYTPTTPDWEAVEGEPGYIKNKPGNTTVNPDTGETEVVKIESQYVETVTKVEDTTAQANEIPTVSAVQELIQQAIDESLYVDEEDYV